jgi:hypothetical protein
MSAPALDPFGMKNLQELKFTRMRHQTPALAVDAEHDGIEFEEARMLFIALVRSQRDFRILEQYRGIDKLDFPLADQNCYYDTDRDGQNSKQAEKTANENENLLFVHVYFRLPSW